MRLVPGISPGVKVAGAFGTTSHPCSAETSRISGALNYPEPLGPPWPVAGHLYFTLFYMTNFLHILQPTYSAVSGLIFFT